MRWILSIYLKKKHKKWKKQFFLQNIELNPIKEIPFLKDSQNISSWLSKMSILKQQKIMKKTCFFVNYSLKKNVVCEIYRFIKERSRKIGKIRRFFTKFQETSFIKKLSFKRKQIKSPFLISPFIDLDCFLKRIGKRTTNEEIRNFREAMQNPAKKIPSFKL